MLIFLCKRHRRKKEWRKWWKTTRATLETICSSSRFDAMFLHPTECKVTMNVTSPLITKCYSKGNTRYLRRQSVSVLLFIAFSSRYNGRKWQIRNGGGSGSRNRKTEPKQTDINFWFLSQLTHRSTELRPQLVTNVAAFNETRKFITAFT